MKKILIALVLVALLGGTGYYFFTRSVEPQAQATGDTTSPPAPALTAGYTNAQYGFALKMPAGFATNEVADDNGGQTIVLQNTSGDGIQIIISPFDEDPQDGSGYTLTRERILQDLPSMQIVGEQPVDIGANYHGLAFTSDNDAFGPASRAVWFVYKGNLYQINTYARLDNLLKAIFATWNFN